MIKLVTVGEMQQIEQEADTSGLTFAAMMENAGNELGDIIHEVYGGKIEQKACALVGSGNNGGDALVALIRLAEHGWKVEAYLVRPRAKGDPLIARFVASGGKVTNRSEDDESLQLKGLLGNCSVLLDGVLGTGAKLPLKHEVKEVLDFVNHERENLPEPKYTVAVDCPSGIDCDTGEAAAECIPADLTITMAAIKQGLLRFPAADLVGELRLASIGNLNGLKSWDDISRFVVDAETVRSVLPKRPRTAHKGTFGTALIVAGSVNYTGAALLAGKAAYRCGAGLVTLGVPFPLHSALAGQFPEATWLLLPDELGVIASGAASVVLENSSRATALLVGPGLGLEQTTRGFMDKLLDGGTQHQKKAIGFELSKPATSKEGRNLPECVIDADGLKHLARLEDWPKRLPGIAVLTPHPGEMAVLTGLTIDELMADRVATAERYATQWGHVVVFKGAFTVISSPDGKSAIIPVASPALARAGTGDVLAGLIVGLRAQGVGAFQAAVAGAWIHAQAGLRAEKNIGSSASVLAGDLLRSIPVIMSELYK